MFLSGSVEKLMVLTEKETYLRLQPALQEVLDLEAENVVKLHSVVAEDASPVKSPLYIYQLDVHKLGIPDEPSEERVALEEPAGVLLLQSEQLTSGRPDQGQAVLHAPHLERKENESKNKMSALMFISVNQVIELLQACVTTANWLCQWP